ncbi:MAG TPA: MBL fold metallo-hydrolase [Pirellulaceae bacterium]|jgi:glyoxylase-like metal-dependent hydrolase (beta-lactamase superfamily II)|nr:MBL fold metallo-hydrolase [Pirellulaceae bacterium]
MDERSQELTKTGSLSGTPSMMNLSMASGGQGMQIPSSGPISQWDVTSDVAGLTVAFVNAFLVGPPGAPDRGWVLVDAAVPFSAPVLRQAAAERFGPDSRPAAILLTHGHFDHVGGLPELAQAWDVPVYCHPLEMPYVTGRSPYPPPDASLPGGMSFLSRLYPRGPFDFSPYLRELPADGTVPGLSEWRWVATPGHAPGHVSFFREQDRLLLAGDAFVTCAQEYASSSLSQMPIGVFGPPAYFTPDWNSARASVESLAALGPRVAATGHGRPVEGEDLRGGLDTLLEYWEEIVVPQNGRYSHEAAVCDLTGVVSFPPPKHDMRLTMIVAGVVIGVGAALLLSGRRDRMA